LQPPVLGMLSSKILLECPVRTSASGATYSYDCNFEFLQFDDAHPHPNIVATSEGRAHLKLTIVPNHQSQALISIDPTVIKDLTKHPPEYTKMKGSSLTLQEGRP